MTKQLHARAEFQILQTFHDMALLDESVQFDAIKMASKLMKNYSVLEMYMGKWR
jgi:hypothetical protein